MQRNFYISPAYIVGEDTGVITVTESGDFPGQVVIHTRETKDQEYFGKLYVDMPPEFMRMLAKAILKVCDELETKE